MASVHVKSEKEVTLDELVKIADAIWALVRKHPCDENSQKQLMTRIQRDCPQFCTSYPVVVKYMVYMRMYDSKTYRLWLDRIQRTPWTNESTYLDALADYATALTMTSCRRRRKHFGPAEKADFKKSIRSALQQEHDELKNAAERAVQSVKEDHERYEQSARDQLAAAARAFGPDGMAAAGTFRVEADVAGGVSPDELPVVELIGPEFDL